MLYDYIYYMGTCVCVYTRICNVCILYMLYYIYMYILCNNMYNMNIYIYIYISKYIRYVNR